MCDLFQMDLTNAELSLPITGGARKCIGSPVAHFTVQMSPFSGQRWLPFTIKSDFMGLYAGLSGRGCFGFLNGLHCRRLKLITGSLSTVAYFDARGFIWVAHFLEPSYKSAR